MKIAIDTRHDTLEEALAVVALAFEASGQTGPKKAKRSAGRATSSRKTRRRRTAPAEADALSPGTESRSTTKPDGANRRANASKATPRKRADTSAVADESPSKRGKTRKAAVTTATTSVTVPASGSAKKAAASKAPAAKKSLSKSAAATRKTPTAKGVAAKKTIAKQAKTRPPAATNVAPPGQSDTIRAWARSNGLQVGDAGRMSAAVIAAYNARHNN